MNIEHTFIDWVSLIVGILAIMFVAVTLFLRGNDYRRKAHLNHIAVIRIIGFITAGFSPVGVVPYWILTHCWPSLFMSIFLFGIACVFFTTEGLPPWWTRLTKGSSSPENKDKDYGNSD